MQDSIVFYGSFYEAIKEIEDTETRLKALEAICEYGFYGVEPNIKGVASAIFKLARPQLDANARRRANGSKGGRPSQTTPEPNQKQEVTEPEPTDNQKATKAEPKETYAKTEQKPKRNQSITKPEPKKNRGVTEPEPNVNVNVNANVNVNNRDAKASSARARFKAPTLEEVQAYCRERKNHVDAPKFLAYYESNGWRVGKNPMKDWRAAVRNWERTSFDSRVSYSKKLQEYGERNYTDEDFAALIHDPLKDIPLDDTLLGFDEEI